MGNVSLVEFRQPDSLSFQIATDFSPSAYAVMGISGFIEVVGLTLWGYELVANMRAGKKAENEVGLPTTIQQPRIAPNTKVGDVLARYPQSLEVFVRRGFTPLRNPVLRKTPARAITIEQACRREGIDLAELLQELKQFEDDYRGSSSELVSITRIEQAHGV